MAAPQGGSRHDHVRRPDRNPTARTHSRFPGAAGSKPACRAVWHLAVCQKASMSLTYAYGISANPALIQINRGGNFDANRQPSATAQHLHLRPIRLRALVTGPHTSWLRRARDGRRSVHLHDAARSCVCQSKGAKTNHMSPKRSLQPCSRHSSLAARGPSAAILPMVRAHNIYPCGFAISQRHCRTCMLWCPECHGPIATASSYRPGRFAGRCFLKPCPRIVLTSRSHNRVPRDRRPDTCTQNA